MLRLMAAAKKEGRRDEQWDSNAAASRGRRFLVLLSPQPFCFHTEGTRLLLRHDDGVDHMDHAVAGHDVGLHDVGVVNLYLLAIH